MKEKFHNFKTTQNLEAVKLELHYANTYNCELNSIYIKS